MGPVGSQPYDQKIKHKTTFKSTCLFSDQLKVFGLLAIFVIFWDYFSQILDFLGYLP